MIDSNETLCQSHLEVLLEIIKSEKLEISQSYESKKLFIHTTLCFYYF